MKRFLEYIKNELKYFIKDEGMKLIMIVGIILYPIFYAIPYSSEVIQEAPIAVVDYDQTNLSRTFSRNIDATDTIKIVSSPINIKDAEKEFFKDKIKGFIAIPKDFEKDILRGKQANISLYVDSSYLIIYKAIYSKTIETAIETGAKIEVAKMVKKGIPKQKAIAIKQPFEFIQMPLYNPAGGYATYVYPMILILILHQTLLVGLGMRIGTKKEKEVKESRSPFILFSRVTTYVLLYLIYSIAFFLIYPAIINYPMAYNILPLFIVLTAMFYAVGFFAYTISNIFKERESALLFFVVTSLIFIFLPGVIWPKEAMSPIINIIASFVPATSAVDSIIKLNQMGATFWDIKYNFLWLIFLNILYFSISCCILKKEGKETYDNND